MTGRWDVTFHDPALWRVTSANFPTLKLKDLVFTFSGGTPPKSEPSYWFGSIPWASPKDFNDFEITDTEDCLTEDGVEAAKLQIAKPGSVLVVVRSGILKHTLPVSINTCPIVVNQDVKVLIPRDNCSGRFLAWYLTVLQDRILPLIVKHSTTVQSVNTKEFEQLKIPLPPLQKQLEFVAALDEARSQRKQKIAEADDLLSSLDDYLLNTLGLGRPDEVDRKVFSIQFSGIGGRLDPHFHAPKFEKINRLLSTIANVSLGSLVEFSKETWKPEDETNSTFRYIEIGSVNQKTGDARWVEVPTKEAPSRARMSVREGDIIVSLTRPHHGSIAYLSSEFEGCIASTGFAVIRYISRLVNREYLWCILRSQLCLQQMLQRSSGGNYPAIIKSELENVVVPLPDMSVQQSIVTEMQNRRDAARRLRSEAETDWQEAKKWFEEQLLGATPL